MKKILLFIYLNYCFVFLAVSISAQDFQTVQDGIEHAKLTRKIKDEPVVINLLRLDLSKVRLDVVHAMDAAIGTETTSSMAARHGAFAAINAGFFRLDRSIFAGDAVGVLKIDNNLYSESTNGRIALMISNNADRTEVFIERANVSDFVTIKGKDFDVGRNRERKDDDLVIFTNVFHPTTLTANNGVEFVIKNNKIRQIFDGKGSNRIPPDGYVLSASGKMRKQLLDLIKIGTKVKLFGKHSSPTNFMASSAYGRSEDITNGVPQLIKNGKIAITWEQEKSSKAFVETRHPRTAVAKLKDGKFLMVTVDGRQPGTSVGMNLNELAEMLLELGAVDAMNLDGGGSTTMFLGGKIVNKPSDKEGERKVSDAILVFPRRK
ncbi:MAG: phosphodiester glycosidase family protein, partial [Acidobacteriota bacterium]|nr:phosphodiester glycosidase family protein [Acidobacteriota bacterium]